MAGTARRGDFAEGKRQAARFFFRHELCKVDAQLDLVAAGDETALRMRPEWF